VKQKVNCFQAAAVSLRFFKQYMVGTKIVGHVWQGIMIIFNWIMSKMTGWRFEIHEVNMQHAIDTVFILYSSIRYSLQQMQDVGPFLIWSLLVRQKTSAEFNQLANINSKDSSLQALTVITKRKKFIDDDRKS